VRHMTHAAFASKAFGVSAFVAGVPLVIIPNVVLSLLGLPTGGDPWVRLWAMEVVVLGFYYIAAGRAEVRAFFVASVYGRFAFAAALVGLVLLVSAPWQVFIIGGIDALGAVWTLSALERDAVEFRSNV
jgi:hypothetical protein